MSRVLVLARDLPHPPNAGDRIVTNGFLRGLAERGHDLHLLSYGRAADEPRADALRTVCASVTTVPPADSRLPTPLTKAAAYAAGRSRVMEMFHSDAFRDATRRAVMSLRPDVVLAEHPYMGQFFLDEEVAGAATDAGARLATNAHVVEYAVHRAYRRYADGLAARAELALETPLLEREELAVYDASDVTLVLGAEDGAELRGRVASPVRRQHVGLAVDEYETADESGTTSEPGAAGEPASNRLLFFGSYEWFPNEDAVTVFAERAFPQIAAAVPAAELVVAGRDAPPAVRSLDERPGVTFAGEVDDLGALVRDAAVVVAPLRIGGGTRLKILESMAWGAPVVTTAPGFEGVDAEPGRDLLVAGDWREFVELTVDLLESPAERRRLGRNARRRVEDRYTVERAGAELAANLELP